MHRNRGSRFFGGSADAEEREGEREREMWLSVCCGGASRYVAVRANLVAGVYIMDVNLKSFRIAPFPGVLTVFYYSYSSRAVHTP